MTRTYRRTKIFNNKRDHAASSYFGVSIDRFHDSERPWVARIYKRNKEGRRLSHTIGRYETELQAAYAVEKAIDEDYPDTNEY